MSSVASLFGQGGNKKFIEGNVALVQTWGFFGKEENQKLLLCILRSTSYPDFFNSLFLNLLQFELPAKANKR